MSITEYSTITGYGKQIPLKYKFDSEKFVDWTEQNFQYVQYNPRKDINRQGLSITSLDGGLSGRPDLDSIYEYNREHGTNYTERDFKTTTPVYNDECKKLLGRFENHLFRTHILRLGEGGFFPPHRDLRGDRFHSIRLICPLKNITPPSTIFCLDDNKPLQWEKGRLYFLDTAVLHYIFNMNVDPSYWLVANVDLNQDSLDGVVSNMQHI